MIQTVSMSADTSPRLTLKLNDWLKGWAEDRILDIQFVYREDLAESYLAFVVYRK